MSANDKKISSKVIAPLALFYQFRSNRNQINNNKFSSSNIGHRAHTVYVGVHVPARRSHRRRKHLPKDNGDKGSQDSQERPGKAFSLELILRDKLVG